MVNNKKNIDLIKKNSDLIKKIILLLSLVFFSNLFYLYSKKNKTETFVYSNPDRNTNADIYNATIRFLKTDIQDTNIKNKIDVPAGGDYKITNLVHAVDYALSDTKKSFFDGGTQGKPEKFPINTIVDDAKTEINCGNNQNRIACAYDPNSLAFGYNIVTNEPGPTRSSQSNHIRIDANPNIYLDNYDQIDKILEREKTDKNYSKKTLEDDEDAVIDQSYKLRDEDKGTVNRRGAVEVAYSRKEELNNTKNKYNIENIRNNSINIQYIFLFCVILASIIVLGLYYISFISNSVLIIYIILVILVIYFFNIINIIN